VKIPARYLILTITLVLQTAASLFQQGVGALQPFIAQRLQLDHQQIGMIVASVSLGSAAFATLAGVAVDYFGERAVLLWSGIAMGLALCAASFMSNLWWLVAWMFVFGMAYGTSNPSGGRAILLWFTSDRGFAMGIRQTGVPLGGVIGSLFLPVIALHWGYQPAIFTAGIICILATVVCIQGYRRPQSDFEADPQTLAEVWRGMLLISTSPVSICINLAAASLMTVQYTAMSFLAIALITLKHAPLTVAVAAMAVFQLGSTLGRLGWGAVSDHFFGGERMGPIMLISVLTLAVLPWIAKSGQASTLSIFALAGVLGATVAAWNGLWATAQAEIGGPRLAGSAIGTSLSLLYFVGAIVPPLFGTLVDHTNFTVAWYSLSILVALGIIPGFMARRLLLRAR
jgi:ACS family hexuronate transporter-like MFS transporter